MARLKWRYLVCVVALALFVGCAQQSSDRPKTVKVTGTVTLDETAVDGATGTFHPDAGGTAAVGKTDASGRFSLTTFESGDGAQPGSYKISVRKTAGQEAGGASGPPSEEELKQRAQQAMKAAMEGRPTQQSENLLPQKYASPATSALSEVVKDGQKNDFEIQLTQ